MADRIRKALEARQMAPADLIAKKVLSKAGVYFLLDGTTTAAKVRDETVTKLCKALQVRREWLKYGRGAMDDAASTLGPKASTVDQPARIFTKERRASDDVLAVQIGLESLLVAVLQRAPGAAAAFLVDVKEVAKGHRFSTQAGFLGSLVDIAQQVQSEEEAVPRVRRHAGSAARTKRGKLDQDS